MKITKRQLRKIIREEKRRLLETHHDGMQLEPEHWDITPHPEFGGAPCPHAVAGAIKSSNASDTDILSWLHVLTMDLAVGGGTEDIVTGIEMLGTGDELAGLK